MDTLKKIYAALLAECLKISSNCTAQHSFLYNKEKKQLIAFGRNDFGQLGNGKSGKDKKELKPICVMKMNVELVAMGCKHTSMKRENGEVVCWQRHVGV